MHGYHTHHAPAVGTTVDVHSDRLFAKLICSPVPFVCHFLLILARGGFDFLPSSLSSPRSGRTDNGGRTDNRGPRNVWDAPSGGGGGGGSGGILRGGRTRGSDGPGNRKRLTAISTL